MIVRSIQNLMSRDKHNEIEFELQTHSVIGKGVTALCLSRLGQFVYSAGEDGSIFIHSLTQGERYPSNEVADESVGAAEIAKLPTVEEKDHDSLLYVVDIIQQEANRVNEDKKRIFRSEIMDELEIIQKKLHKLLSENDNVVDIEKLERDDFVIDVERQEQFVADGEHVCNLIRKDAEKETLKLKLLHEIVKKNT